MLNSNATAYLVLKKSTKFLKILPAGKSTIINKNGLKGPKQEKRLRGQVDIDLRS